MRLPAFAFAMIVSLLGGSHVFADGKNPTYMDDVLPVFKQHCNNCHGNDQQKGDLNLATYAALQQGGSSGAVVMPGSPDKSRLYLLTNHDAEPKMPPKSAKIPEAQITLLKLWIEQGAKENASSKVNIPAATKTDIGLKSVVKGRPEGAPPMPVLGKLKLEPVSVARRPGAILALAASPWAPLVAIGGQKQVILYNTDTGDLVGVIPFEHGQINSIKFARNGKFLLVAGGKGGASGSAVLFKVETGEKVLAVGKSETDAILAADISADQTQIAVGGPSKLVRIYSTTDGSVVREIKKHTDWVTAVEYSPDGVLLATGDRNGGLFVWEAFTGREFFGLRGHTAMITDVSWRDDSNVLASSSEDGTVRLWGMENGNQIKNWRAHGGGAASVRFTHDGKLASTGRDKVTKLWDQNGAAQKSFEAFQDLGLRVAVTHENGKVIAGDWAGVVKTWTIADAKLLARFDSNPKPLAERLKEAEALVATATSALNAAEVKAKQAAEAHNTASASANKITAELAAAQKAVADATNMSNAIKPTIDALKAEVDKATPAATTAANAAAALETVVAAESEAAKKIAEAATKSPGNSDLAARSKKKSEALAALNTELEAARKAQTASASSLQTATDKHAAALKAVTNANSQLSENQKKVAGLQPMVKPAADAAAATKSALDTANAAVAATKATLDLAKTELKRASSLAELVKQGTGPKR